MIQSEGNDLNSIARLASILLLLLVIGCKEEVTQPPNDLISEGEFVEILVEMNLIEATRSMHASKEHKEDIHPTVFYRQLWEDHSISEEQFNNSFDFYRNDLIRMADLYEQAAQILKRKEDDINAAKKAAKENKIVP